MKGKPLKLQRKRARKEGKKDRNGVKIKIDMKYIEENRGNGKVEREFFLGIRTNWNMWKRIFKDLQTKLF